MRRRLDGRTKGLLETRERLYLGNMGGPFLSYDVDFLHRTARDFVNSRDIQQMLRPYIPPNFNPHMRIIKALLA